MGRQRGDPIGLNSPAHFAFRANDRDLRVCVISVVFNINFGLKIFSLSPLPLLNLMQLSPLLEGCFANMQQ